MNGDVFFFFAPTVKNCTSRARMRQIRIVARERIVVRHPKQQPSQKENQFDCVEHCSWCRMKHAHQNWMAQNSGRKMEKKKMFSVSFVRARACASGCPLELDDGLHLSPYSTTLANNDSEATNRREGEREVNDRSCKWTNKRVFRLSSVFFTFRSNNSTDQFREIERQRRQRWWQWQITTDNRKRPIRLVLDEIEQF